MEPVRLRVEVSSLSGSVGLLDLSRPTSLSDIKGAIQALGVASCDEQRLVWGDVARVPRRRRQRRTSAVDVRVAHRTVAAGLDEPTRQVCIKPRDRAPRSKRDTGPVDVRAASSRAETAD